MYFWNVTYYGLIADKISEAFFICTFLSTTEFTNGSLLTPAMAVGEVQSWYRMGWVHVHVHTLPSPYAVDVNFCSLGYGAGFEVLCDGL